MRGGDEMTNAIRPRKPANQFAYTRVQGAAALHNNTQPWEAGVTSTQHAASGKRLGRGWEEVGPCTRTQGTTAGRTRGTRQRCRHGSRQDPAGLEPATETEAPAQFKGRDIWFMWCKSCAFAQRRGGGARVSNRIATSQTTTAPAAQYPHRRTPSIPPPQANTLTGSSSSSSKLTMGPWIMTPADRPHSTVSMDSRVLCHAGMDTCTQQQSTQTRVHRA